MTPDERVTVHGGRVRINGRGIQRWLGRGVQPPHEVNGDAAAIRRAINEAVAAERERCAAIAAVVARELTTDAEAGMGDSERLYERAETAWSIVKMIRDA